MILHFRTNSLQKSLNDDRNRLATYGRDRARKIAQRLNELHVAESLADIFKLPFANCHEHDGDERGLFTVDISRNFRLFFQPIEVEEIPRQKEQILDYKSIVEVTVTKIEDPH